VVYSVELDATCDDGLHFERMDARGAVENFAPLRYTCVPYRAVLHRSDSLDHTAPSTATSIYIARRLSVIRFLPDSVFAIV
jgi:hypothetical protein